MNPHYRSRDGGRRFDGRQNHHGRQGPHRPVMRTVGPTKRFPAIRPPAPPRSGKRRRRALKAATWRLAKLTGVPCPRILSILRDAKPFSEIAHSLVERVDRRTDFGPAMRLANKIIRLQGKGGPTVAPHGSRVVPITRGKG